MRRGVSEVVPELRADAEGVDRLCREQNECVFNWSTADGWPVGVVMSFVRRDGRLPSGGSLADHLDVRVGGDRLGEADLLPQLDPGERDLARQLKVSHVTVSMALRDHPRISPQRREQVRALIAEKGLGAIRFYDGERALQSKIAGLIWSQSYSVGNAFYQAFDVTEAGMGVTQAGDAP